MAGGDLAGLRRIVRVGGFGFAAAVLLLSLFALSRAPVSADLYNLLYGNSRPAKPEGTLIFLLLLPVCLLGVTTLNLVAPARTGVARSSAFGLIFYAAGVGTLGGIGIYRSLAVLAAF